MADIFNREIPFTTGAITSDKAAIIWDGTVASAISLNLSYSQPIIRRHTIGSKGVILHNGQPAGQLQIGRIVTDTAAELFKKSGWDGCTPATITLAFHAGCSAGKALTYTMTGCIVNGYSLQTDAEGLTVADNVSIEFVSLAAE